MRPKHSYISSGALEANLLLVKVYHMVEITSQWPKTVKMSPCAPICWRTPQRPISAYCTIHRWLAHGVRSGRQTSNSCKSLAAAYFCDFFYFHDFVDFRFFAKVLDFVGMSMETFIRLWPILYFGSPRASNELTNDVWCVGIGRWGARQQMGPRMWILTDFKDCEISQKSANSWILLTLRGQILP